MNVLSYRTSDQNFLTFDLLVDDVPIYELIGTDCLGIPHFMFEGGMPRKNDIEDEFFISVCGCGIDGCGSVSCTIQQVGDEVVFCDFKFCQRNPTFRFSESNFKQVLEQIRSECRVETERQDTLALDYVLNESETQYNRESIAAYVKSVATVLTLPDIKELISDETRTSNFTAHEVAKWLTTDRAYDLVLEHVPPELRELKKTHLPMPRICHFIPFEWGLHVCGDTDALNVICAGYGEGRTDLIEIVTIPLPNFGCVDS